MNMGPIRKIIFHQVDSVIRGHHAYKKCWTPYVGETLTCCRERDNKYDDNAVAVLKMGKLSGTFHGNKVLSSRDSLTGDRK